MSRQIKLIWDFRGEVAAKTAEHHEIHDYFMESESDNIESALKEFDGDYDLDELRLMRIKFISEVAN